MPYAFHLQADAVRQILETTGISILGIGAASAVQSSVLFAVTAALGLWANRAAGLCTPILDAWLSDRSAGWTWLTVPVLLGLGCGGLIFGLDAALAPLMPPEVVQVTAEAVPLAWKGMLAWFYGDHRAPLTDGGVPGVVPQRGRGGRVRLALVTVGRWASARLAQPAPQFQARLIHGNGRTGISLSPVMTGTRARSTAKLGPKRRTPPEGTAKKGIPQGPSRV